MDIYVFVTHDTNDSISISKIQTRTNKFQESSSIDRVEYIQQPINHLSSANKRGLCCQGFCKARSTTRVGLDKNCNKDCQRNGQWNMRWPR